MLAFLLALGFQLKHKATCDGEGCLTRHSHYVRVCLGGVTIRRLECTTGKAVFTILPHFILRYRQMRPEVAHNVLLATHGGIVKLIGPLDGLYAVWHHRAMNTSPTADLYKRHRFPAEIIRHYRK